MALKIKNIPFIGGDTAEFEFDFGTKVAGSTAECPLNWYYGASESLMTPSTAKATGSTLDKWNTDTAQVSFDQLKFQDGSYVPYSINTANYIAQFMVELDLTSLCNSLFGGNTSTMKAALKSFQLDVWGKGSGVNNSVLANNFTWQVWWNGDDPKWGQNGWPGWYGKHSNVDISELKDNSMSSSDCVNYLISASNKIYILLLSTYSSNGTISSEIDLDYINIKIQFARVPDVMNLLPITFTNTWSMLIKGFSPAWDNNSVNGIKFLLGIDQSEHSNYDVSYQGGKFVFDNWDGNTAENLWSDPINLTKFQTVNLLIEQTSSGRRMRILQNNGQVLKYSISSSRNFPGDKQMGVLMHTTGQYQADAFLNNLVFLPDKTFDDDTEAEAVLRGTAQGFENDELFDINKLPTNSKNIVNEAQGTLTINADSQWEGVYVLIPVLPNNKYHFHCITNNSNLAFVRIDEFYNNISVNSNIGSRGIDFDIITGSKTNNIFLLLTNSAAGSITYSDISFKLKM